MNLNHEVGIKYKLTVSNIIGYGASGANFSLLDHVQASFGVFNFDQFFFARSLNFKDFAHTAVVMTMLLCCN